MMEGSTKPQPSSARPDENDIEAGAHGSTSNHGLDDFRTLLADQESSVKHLGGTGNAGNAGNEKSNEDTSQATEKLNPAQFSTATGNSGSENIKSAMGGKEQPAKTSQKSSNKSSLPKQLMNLRELNDKKVVGLKHYGMTKSTRDMRKHEWLSARSVQSHPEVPTASNRNDVFELTNTTGAIPPRTDNTGTYVFPGPDQLALPKGADDAPAPFVRPPKIPQSVEELEEKARRKATLNPFELLFLGNLAALKVMGFYLITLETIISCGVVS